MNSLPSACSTAQRSVTRYFSEGLGEAIYSIISCVKVHLSSGNLFLDPACHAAFTMTYSQGQDTYLGDHIMP